MQAVIICTRNRPPDLRRTLRSIAEQRTEDELHLLVVDASDEQERECNREAVAEVLTHPARHLAFPAPPALPRQRNYGIDRVPVSADVVHFVDDDVAMEPGYFQNVAEAIREHPEAGGAGGLFTEPLVQTNAVPSVKKNQQVRRFFLLASAVPGRVLPSGYAVPGQRPFSTAQRSEWLAGCSMSFRRSVLGAYRFDETSAGYTTFDDTDLSYRVSRERPLLVVPEARLVHHRSPTNRHDAERFGREALVSRYWFVEKNIRHPLRKPAFWWTTLGQVLARATSRRPEATEALRGLWQGVRTVWHRDHPLLRRDRQ